MNEYCVTCKQLIKKDIKTSKGWVKSPCLRCGILVEHRISAHPNSKYCLNCKQELKKQLRKGF